MVNSFLIPSRNCLVLMIGPSGSGKSTLAKSLFKHYEIIASDDIRESLTDDFRRQDKNDDVFQELRSRIATRLKLGLRTVVDATNLKVADRQQFISIAHIFNVTIIYLVVNRPINDKIATAGWRGNIMFADNKTLIEKHEEIFVSNEKAILRGDGDKDIRVIDSRVHDIEVVDMKKFHPDYSDMLKLYKNIRIIADIHGNYSGLQCALDAPENTFFVFMGDVVDYGDNVVDTFNTVYSLVNDGKAICVRGNHEKKMATLISYVNEHGDFGKKRVSHGNQATFDQLATLNAATRSKWEKEFLVFEDMCPDYVRFANVLLTHGACHHSMWNDDHFRVHTRSKIESFAMYGETTGEFVDDYPVRIYDWVNLIPSDKLVIVGHDIRDNTQPFIDHGALGGTVIFLDTGSSKGGKLSWVDGNIIDDKFIINNIQSV